MSKILISACLAGFPVRYNESDKKTVSEYLDIWHKENRLVTFCPELAAGFPTPRPSAEIIPALSGRAVITQGARVIESSGTDVTEKYILGAWLALKMAKEHDCRFALLTEGSPSCGSQRVYNGQFNGQTTAGYGVVAELLLIHGIEVFAEHNISALVQRVSEDDQQNREGVRERSRITPYYSE
ncbi:DUF523 domain-containing protein [Pectobacteriaceae bacterium C52]|nr:DUF523 domain-containing protein [Pectobacteriaceae bacterium C52]